MRRGLGAYSLALAAVAVLVPLHRWWAAQVLLVPLLLIVPGSILLQALRIPSRVVRSFPVYVPCASIIVLFGAGVAVDMAGPLAGVAEPLRAVPLLIGFEVTCAGLLVACASAPADVTIEWRSPRRPVRVAVPLLIPLAAAAGAMRLNTGHGNTVAVVAAVAIVGSLIVAAALSARLDQALLEMVLYSAGLAMIWACSLRGDPLYGFDISAEYQRLSHTVSTGIWPFAHPGDAYGAMLSVTVMPAELHVLSGIPALLIFKVVYPMIFALFPVAIFGLARKVLVRPWAFIAAAFTIGQYAFTELATLARQEIALVLFAALIAAMLDSRVRRGPRWRLVALLGVALAVSHYSTTYLAITLLGLLVPLQFGLSWIRRVPRVTGAVVVAFLATLAGAVIWYGPVTHSESHLMQVVQTVQDQGLDILPNRTPGSSLLSAYLQGNSRTTISAGVYAQRIAAYYARTRPYVHPLGKVAAERQYDLRNTSVPDTPVRWQAGYTAVTLSLLVIEQLANLLAAVGALLMVLRRKASLLTRQIGLAALAATSLLTVIRFSGTLAAAYGQERAQLQALVILAVTMCWTFQARTGWRQHWQARIRVLASGCLAVVFVNTVYLVGAVLGGATSVNLASSGPVFEYFYVTAPEIASARWLGSQFRTGDLVYADEYGQVPLAAGTSIQDGLMTDLTPRTLSASNTWVYASHANVVNQKSFALYNNRLATYVFPARFLDANYSVVYTNGSSEVFHR
ncbi:MAG TPA: hypothetical protein VMH35_22930 [Streptosporangiaceae bacterium]|nr:hypothetical protein [Streptosporangiaceae bacterium]